MSKATTPSSRTNEPTTATESDLLLADEVVAIDRSEEEIAVGEIDNETDRKLFSTYLPLISH